ncbi:MAG TPA: hypothetical protein VMK12_01975 [Anaeromyxobacteraceae bacterium]|nr:hypothetical protein [Anaeromyxobacteraceae bacterium]
MNAGGKGRRRSTGPHGDPDLASTSARATSSPMIGSGTTALRERADSLQLLLRQQLGLDFIDTELTRKCSRSTLRSR